VVDIEADIFCAFAPFVNDSRARLEAVGFFDRLGGLLSGAKAREARHKELAGDLEAATELYADAEMPDEAARLLLLRADAERSPERRIALCALAAETAADEALRKQAAARKALLGLDLLRGRAGPVLTTDVLAVARALEDAGEPERAAEAYALAGDDEAEVRALTAAGAIEKLEARLGQTARADRQRHELELALTRIADLDRAAERRAALRLARELPAGPEAERAADAARAIAARLVRGPIVGLELDGVGLRCVLGDEVTIGRGEASVVVASRAVSRVHLRIRRTAAGAVVEDLGGRNGTRLAGARLCGAVPVGDGLRLELGGEVPCAIAPAGGEGWATPAMIAIDVAGEHVLAALGELEVGPWRVAREVEGDDAFVALRTPPGAPRPLLGGLELAASVELAAGDELCAERGGPVRLRVLASPGVGGPLA
jgi:hypothetical protein